MNDKALEIYRQHISDLKQTEGGYFVGQCPFCGEEDGFIAGPRSVATGELTNDFVCLNCGEEGTPRDFVEVLRGDEIDESGEAESPLNPEIVDGLDLGKTFQEDQKIFTESEGKNSLEPEEFSNLGILMRLIDKKLSGVQFRIAILLASNGKGLSVEEISRETKIPLSSVYRALKPVKGIEVFHPTGENTYILGFENEISQN
jgi:hypothetical protein